MTELTRLMRRYPREGYMLSSISSTIKWKAFSMLNRLADVRSQTSAEPGIYPPTNYSDSAGDLIWVFCSTIGELNACLPFIKSLELRGQLVLITDRHCYRESYQKHFGNAYVVELTGRTTDGSYLTAQLPPSLFFVCEIPAMPCDAPCRLSYGLLHQAKSVGARVHLVNAWLYDYAPACRMDSLEVRLFRKEYLDSFDSIGVQNENIRSRLIQAGAREERISITGNMKFDSLWDENIRITDETSRPILSYLENSNSPIVVAGCLADIDECYILIDAIRAIRISHPDIRIIIAPRHPENQCFMQSLTEKLEQSGLVYKMKSKLSTADLAGNDLLLLDTFGELKSFYSIATICYVGCNHNVLEPLAFGKPTIVSGEWNPLYPSYPVYQLTRDKKLIMHVDKSEGISRKIIEYTTKNASEEGRSKQIFAQLKSLSGAVERTLKTTQLASYQ